MAKETAVEIIDIYTHKVEQRLDKLGTYLVFVVIPLLLIIAMQLGALIIYLLRFQGLAWDSRYSRILFLESAADGVFWG